MHKLWPSLYGPWGNIFYLWSAMFGLSLYLSRNTEV